jgi:hypothetical protein
MADAQKYFLPVKKTSCLMAGRQTKPLKPTFPSLKKWDGITNPGLFVIQHDASGNGLNHFDF